MAFDGVGRGVGSCVLEDCAERVREETCELTPVLLEDTDFVAAGALPNLPVLLGDFAGGGCIRGAAGNALLGCAVVFCFLFDGPCPVSLFRDILIA